MTTKSSPFETVLLRVDRYRLTGGDRPGERRAVATCPCCVDDGLTYAIQPIGDDGPSLHISEDAKGDVHVVCLNCCDPGEIYAELGIKKPQMIAPPKLRAHEALQLLWLEHWVLQTAAGKLAHHEPFAVGDRQRVEQCYERLQRVAEFYPRSLV